MCMHGCANNVPTVVGTSCSQSCLLFLRLNCPQGFTKSKEVTTVVDECICVAVLYPCFSPILLIFLIILGMA